MDYFFRNVKCTKIKYVSRRLYDFYVIHHCTGNPHISIKSILWNQTNTLSQTFQPTTSHKHLDYNRNGCMHFSQKINEQRLYKILYKRL